MMLRVELRRNTIRIGARVEIALQATLRVPDDGRTYPLPPGLGAIPIRRAREGFVAPLWQREALWISFRSLRGAWTAIQVAAGGVNALTGEPFPAPLQADPQNYLVAPEQPWLDGIVTARGVVRQFVAAPLGKGVSIGEQLASAGRSDTLRIRLFASKKPLPRREPAMALEGAVAIGAGGLIEQKVYPDPFGLRVWDARNFGEAEIRLVNSLEWRAISGEDPPPSPVSARDYSDWGLPWFSLYDEDQAALAGTGKFAGIRRVVEGEPGVEPRNVKRIVRKRPTLDIPRRPE